MTPRNYLIPYIITNVLSILLIFICYKWSKVGKIMWGMIFLAAGIFNVITSFRTPHAYVEVYGQTAVLPFYKNFIYGTFSDHTTLFVTLIASGQILVSILLFLKRMLFRLGTIGGMIFLIAISPLGIGSAFPSTILMAISLFILFKKVN